MKKSRSIGLELKEKTTRSANKQSPEMTRLHQLGKELFGSAASYEEWLHTPSEMGILKGKTPLSLLKTSAGIDLVYEELKRIEFGATA